MQRFLIILFVLVLTVFTNAVFSQISTIKTVVSLTGSFFDESTKEPVTVRFEAFDESGKRVFRGNSNAAEKGYYFITGLQPGKTYKIRTTDMNFLSQEIEYTLPLTDKYQEFSKDFLVVTKTRNTEIMFGVSPFELSKSKIRYGIEYYLDDIEEIITSNNRIVFELVCYPDNNLNPDHNNKLTLDRANALKAYLVSKGCKDDKIVVRSEQATDPKNPPPAKKQAKGKRYIGSTYLIIKEI